MPHGSLSYHNSISLRAVPSPLVQQLTGLGKI
jgi:hypothetical protein